jgi:hypothetical protein
MFPVNFVTYVPGCTDHLHPVRRKSVELGSCRPPAAELNGCHLIQTNRDLPTTVRHQRQIAPAEVIPTAITRVARRQRPAHPLAVRQDERRAFGGEDRPKAGTRGDYDATQDPSCHMASLSG